MKWADNNVNLYGIYDVKCADCCAGVFTLQQALKFLNIKRREFYYALKERKITRYHYRIEYVGKRKELEG